MKLNRSGSLIITAILLIGAISVVGFYILRNKSSNQNVFQTDKSYFYYYSGQKNPLQFIGWNRHPEYKNELAAFVLLGKDPKGDRLLLTDEFIVKLKSNAGQNDLEALNQKNKVTIVRQMLGDSKSFLLSVKDNPNENALDMANRYHDEPVIEFAEPNFLTVKQSME